MELKQAAAAPVRQVTVAMLAKHAGVSRVAVYAAFNSGKKTTVGISEKTREKILAAAEELGYVPNDLARTLVSGQSRTVGLLLKSNDSLMLQRLISAFSHLFVEHGYLLIPESSESSVKREREILSHFLHKRVDCVIVAWFGFDSNGDLLEQFSRCGIPVINILNRQVEHPDSATVSFDEEQVMRLVCELLSRQGIRRIWYAGTEKRENSSSVCRLNYLREAVKACPGLVLAGASCIADAAECREFAAGLRQMDVPPEAVVCYNDRVAQLVAVELRIAGFRIPEEIAVTGVDGYTDPYDPARLTTVRLPVEKLAEAAYRIFREADYRSQLVRIAPELIERETTRNLKQ